MKVEMMVNSRVMKTAEKSRKARSEHRLTAALTVRKKKKKSWIAAECGKILPLQNLVARMNSEIEARRM